MQTVHWEKLFVTIDDESFEIEVPSELNFPTSIRIEGSEIPVDFSPSEGSLQWLLRSAGTRLPVSFQHIPEGLSVHAKGWDFIVKVEDERTRRLRSVLQTGQTKTGSISLNAPMPGLVIRLLKNTGESIAYGEPYAILEAMKMENELRSTLNGTVKEVNAKPGQTVEKGTSLLTIEVESL